MKLRIYIVFFVAGLAVGIIVTLILALHEKKMWLENMAADYTLEQEFLALQAKIDGEYGEAARYYANLRDVYSGRAGNAFDYDRCKIWGMCTFFSPITSLGTNYILGQQKELLGLAGDEASLRRNSSIIMAMRQAYLLEKAGRLEEANRIYRELLAQTPPSERPGLTDEQYLENMHVIGKGIPESEKQYLKTMSEIYQLGRSTEKRVQKP